MSPSPTVEMTGNAVATPQEIAMHRAQNTSRYAWTEHTEPLPRTYHIAAQWGEDDGPVTAYCVELPGAITEAADIEEAARNMREVLQALVEEYRSKGQEVPWVDREPDEGSEICATIILNA